MERANIQPGSPLRLVPQSFPLGFIIDPVDGERLQVWLEPSATPGLIFYYFRRMSPDEDEDERMIPDVPLILPIALPQQNSASRIIYLTGGPTAQAARGAALAAYTGLGIVAGIAAMNAAMGAP